MRLFLRHERVSPSFAARCPVLAPLPENFFFRRKICSTIWTQGAVPSRTLGSSTEGSWTWSPGTRCTLVTEGCHSPARRRVIHMAFTLLDLSLFLLFFFYFLSNHPFGLVIGSVTWCKNNVASFSYTANMVAYPGDLFSCPRCEHANSVPTPPSGSPYALGAAL